MGSRIKQIGKGKWEVEVEAGKDPLTGKRQRIVRRIKGRQQDAEELCAELLIEVKRGTYVKPDKTPFGEYLEHWLSTHKGNIAPSTHEGYRRIIKGHVIPVLGQIPLHNLKTIQIQSYYTEKLNSGLSARTVQQHHSVIRKALQHAVKWELLSKNPAVNTEPPKPDRPPVKYIPPNEIEPFLDTIKGHRDEHLITFAVYTGMRQGEILALTWDNVDLKRGRAKVTQTVGYIREQFVWRQTAKSKKSRRVVRLDDRAISALKKQKAMTNKEKMKSADYNKNNLVIPDQKGRPLNPNDLCRRLKRLAQNADLDITFHSLRHTHATDLLEMGVNPKIVQDRLGIETIGVLYDTYTHVTDSMQQDVVNIMNERSSAKPERK